MKIKLILGIVLPVILILTLAILSVSNIGSSTETENVNSVKFNSLFVSQTSARENAKIQTITLTNEFFLPRKYELPQTIVCLNDKNGVKPRQSLKVIYSEGDLSGGLFSYSKRSVDLPIGSKKQIDIFVEPKIIYSSNYQRELENYKNYDEILIVKIKTDTRYSSLNFYSSSYNSCTNLDSEELENAIRIPITDIPVTPPKPADNLIIETEQSPFQIR